MGNNWKVYERYFPLACSGGHNAAFFKLILPRLCSKTSWNSEPLVHDFMDVLSWQRNVTIRSVTLEPWERYRGVVRIWNEGELELIIRSGFNDSNNRTAFILDHNLFSPTKDFKIIVQRVTSDTNETNTTEQSSTVKVIPGFANPEGPCCVKNPVDPQSVFSDTHFKATLTSQHFGASLARLPNDHFAVGSAQKAFVLPLRNRAANHITLPDDITGSSARPVQVVSYRNRSAFLVNGVKRIFTRTKSITLAILN
ncbi:hypothetical protein OS493_032221 [Desmophyllum pertusum]|uniref:Uncharacterized protein n=1 Tax=Desmophyllum pertusum TaxID=174260 RepID=A0A9X0A0E3_9CNID|nr:hypothetical protein OS493_032221 [Desmophyllum pertusum]